MDIQVGSTLYRNTDGTIVIEGVPQMMVGLKPATGALLVSFVGYDEAGRVQVKVVDSTVAFNERRAFELHRTPSTVELKHIDSGKLVFRIELREGGGIAFREGNFRTLKAHVLEVTLNDWKVDRQRNSGGEVDLQGKSIELG
jgi:hypothetical protein